MGKTKRGKGTKIMAMADGSSVPVSIHTASASPHEVTLVGETLAEGFFGGTPEKLIRDRAYDSDPLDAEFRAMGIEMMIAPHRKNRKKRKTQDGRKLGRYRRRWKVERLFAWLSNFRRLVVRYEWKAQKFWTSCISDVSSSCSDRKYL